MAEQSNLPLVKHRYKTNKEVIQELVDIVFEMLSNEKGANILMLRPALNIGKLKLAQMSEDDAANLILQIHKVSSICENETGIFSPYHGIEE